jgi:hypothetical protein
MYYAVTVGALHITFLEFFFDELPTFVCHISYLEVLLTHMMKFKCSKVAIVFA